MTPAELRVIWERASGQCEVTRIPFSLKKDRGVRRGPWAPSIDRIDRAKGYTFDNCRLVCLAVNFAMNEWGEDILLRIAWALRTQARGLKACKARRRWPKC